MRRPRRLAALAAGDDPVQRRLAAQRIGLGQPLRLVPRVEPEILLHDPFQRPQDVARRQLDALDVHRRQQRLEHDMAPARRDVEQVGHALHEAGGVLRRHTDAEIVRRRVGLQQFAHAPRIAGGDQEHMLRMRRHHLEHALDEQRAHRRLEQVGQRRDHHPLRRAPGRRLGQRLLQFHRAAAFGPVHRLAGVGVVHVEPRLGQAGEAAVRHRLAAQHHVPRPLAVRQAFLAAAQQFAIGHADFRQQLIPFQTHGHSRLPVRVIRSR